MTDDEDARQAYEERSWRELEAGRLPLRAQERLATMAADHAFTSDLSAAEHLAVRGVGFEPVGQVLGACVFQIGYTGGWDCGVQGWGVRGGGYGQWGRPMGGGMGGVRGGGFGGGLGGGGFNSGGFSGQGLGGGGAYGGGYGGQYLTVDTVTVTPWKRSVQQAQQLAMSRLEQEARALGGDGVVAVRFHEKQLGGGLIEFHVLGTAVRGPSTTRSSQVFSSALSGQDFARLVHGGWMPVRLLFGLSVMTRHDDWQTRMNAGSWSNTELAGYTQLVLDARGEARLQLAREAAHVGATDVVLEDSWESTSEHECFFVEGGRDHVVRSTFLGTGLVRTTAGPHRPTPGALPMLRLSPRTTVPRRSVEVP